MPASLRNCSPSGFAAIEDGAGIGLLDAFHHFDGGGFAGTVRTEQTEATAFANLETDLVDRGQRSEAFHQVGNLQDDRHDLPGGMELK